MILRVMTTEGFVVFTCGSCGTKLKVRPSAEGRTAKCPKCGARLRIEIPTAAAPQQQQRHEPPVAVAATTEVSPKFDTATQAPDVPVVPTTTIERTPETHAVAASAATAPASAPVETIAPAPIAAAASPVPSATTAPESRADAAKASDAPAAAAGVARPSSLIAIKSFILLAAVAVIGAFGWFAVVHYGGAKSWIVKQSVVAEIIGFLAASVVLAAGGRGVMAKLASVVAALIAIVLGKAMVVALIDADPGAVPAHDVRAWVSFFAGHAFNVIDVLFAAIAVTGAAIRFILARP